MGEYVEADGSKKTRFSQCAWRHMPPLTFLRLATRLTHSGSVVGCAFCPVASGIQYRCKETHTNS